MLGDDIEKVPVFRKWKPSIEFVALAIPSDAVSK